MCCCQRFKCGRLCFALRSVQNPATQATIDALLLALLQSTPLTNHTPDWMVSRVKAGPRRLDACNVTTPCHWVIVAISNHKKQQPHKLHTSTHIN